MTNELNSEKSFTQKLWFRSIMLLMFGLGVLTYSTNEPDEPQKIVITKGMAYSGSMPRMRINRSASMTLTTAWQTVDFNGTSTVNINTFGNDPNTGNPMVYYDGATKLLKFGQQDINYNLYFSLSTTTSIITLQGLLLYRFVIPNGKGPGVDFIFPNPDNEQYGTVGSLVLIGGQPIPADKSYPLYTTLGLKTNGMYMQLALSNALALGAVATVNHVDLNIQSTAVQN